LGIYVHSFKSGSTASDILASSFFEDYKILTPHEEHGQVANESARFREQSANNKERRTRPVLKKQIR
jgi:hypothetical protein